MCPDYLTLSAYFDGEIPLKDQADIAAHVRSCPRCQSLLDQLEKQSSALKDLALENIPGDTLPEFSFPEKKKQGSGDGSFFTKKRIGTIKLPWPLAAAAAVLLMFLTFSYIRLETRIASGRLVYIDNRKPVMADRAADDSEDYSLDNELAVISMDIPMNMGDFELGDSEFSFEDAGVIWED